jgi:hypothetical protein
MVLEKKEGKSTFMFIEKGTAGSRFLSSAFEMLKNPDS